MRQLRRPFFADCGKRLHDHLMRIHVTPLIITYSMRRVSSIRARLRPKRKELRNKDHQNFLLFHFRFRQTLLQ